MQVREGLRTKRLTGLAITLHIGASKCGSSALQAALSATPTIFREEGTKIEYVVADLRHDRIIRGAKLTGSLKINGYRVSSNADLFVDRSSHRIAAYLRKAQHDVILSSEGWLFQPSQWKHILEQMKLHVDVVVYVRPQVSVLNSAWWQWGAWSDKPFAAWIDQRLKASLWGARIAQWQTLKRVRSITVRPIGGDVVSDFFANILKAPVPQNVSRPNPTLPGPLLRLFQRNRELRPGPHNSRIDFALSQTPVHDDPPIWVMNPELIQKVIDFTRDDTRQLMEYMEPDAAKMVRDDPRWWSADAFADKQAESPDPTPVDPRKLEEMCVSMAQQLFELRS